MMPPLPNCIQTYTAMSNSGNVFHHFCNMEDFCRYLDFMNRPIIDMTEPDEVQQIIDYIDTLHAAGVRYYRQGALFTTASDATNIRQGLKQYRDFLRS